MSYYDQELATLDLKKLHISPVIMEKWKLDEVEEYLLDAIEELCGIKVQPQFCKVHEDRYANVLVGGPVWEALEYLWQTFLSYTKDECEEVLNNIEIL